MALIKRWRYARRSEQLDAVQRSLLDESIDADLEAISLEIEALKGKPSSTPKAQPRRLKLPAQLPQREIRHEPEATKCSCGCELERIGENVSEKLDYTPGVFEVERHIRGKWVCRRCERLIQGPVPAHVIDKGIPTAGLLAQVLIAKYLDHAPLYRQESIFCTSTAQCMTLVGYPLRTRRRLRARVLVQPWIAFGSLCAPGEFVVQRSALMPPDKLLDRRSLELCL